MLRYLLVILGSALIFGCTSTHSIPVQQEKLKIHIDRNGWFKLNGYQGKRRFEELKMLLSKDALRGVSELSIEVDSSLKMGYMLALCDMLHNVAVQPELFYMEPDSGEKKMILCTAPD